MTAFVLLAKSQIFVVLILQLMQTRSAELSRSESPPRYMQPLKSHYKPPSNLDTIDAFTVRPRRKQNIWEEYAPQLEPQFYSVVLPSNRLSQSEVSTFTDHWFKLFYSLLQAIFEHRITVHVPPRQLYNSIGIHCDTKHLVKLNYM